MDMRYVRNLAIGVSILLVALWLAFSGGSDAQVGPPNQALCNNTAPFTGTGAVAAAATAPAGQRLYLCGWHITNTAATGSFTLSYGTGTNCGTNTVAITPAMSVTSTAPSADHIEYAYISTPLAGELCVNATLTTVTGVLFYASF